MTTLAKHILPMLWLLASEHEDPTSGKIEYSLEKIAFRLRMKRKEITDAVKELKDNGFINEINCVTEPLRIRNTRDRDIVRDRDRLTHELFEKFYESYPRKISKQLAENAFKKLKLANGDYNKIMAALEKQKAKWIETGQDKQFIPHPSTWLNQKRWEDEVETSDDYDYMKGIFDDEGHDPEEDV
jgi:DNA-binding Lrp family transcriptional regulator